MQLSFETYILYDKGTYHESHFPVECSNFDNRWVGLGCCCESQKQRLKTGGSDSRTSVPMKGTRFQNQQYRCCFYWTTLWALEDLSKLCFSTLEERSCCSICIYSHLFQLYSHLFQLFCPSQNNPLPKGVPIAKDIELHQMWRDISVSSGNLKWKFFWDSGRFQVEQDPSICLC
jgi:hypothetical protein